MITKINSTFGGTGMPTVDVSCFVSVDIKAYRTHLTKHGPYAAFNIIGD